MKQIARKLKLLAFFVILLGCAGIAQTPVPKGAAFEAIVKAYVARDVTSVEAAYAAFEKVYPGNPYSKFFHAYINDRSGRDIEAALREYSEVIRMAPDLSDPYVYRAMIFSEKGIDEKAKADMTSAIEIEGKDAPAYYFSLRGDYYNNTKEYMQAIGDFKKAIALAPAAAQFYRGLMNVSINAGTPAEAERTFLEAIGGTQKDNAAIQFVYADFLLRQKRMGDADKVFTQAIANNNYQPTGEELNSASIAALNGKDLPRAIRLSEQAMLLSPKNVDIINNRASIAVQQQQWEEVYKWAGKALMVDNNSPLANMLMAVAIKRTGKGDALSAQYEARAKKLEAGGN
jgi:tetratricopeptide (TPR) repeat protein